MERSTPDTAERRTPRPLLVLKKLLSRYSRWYDGQVELNRRRIEQDVRRFGGSVRWDQ